MRTALCKLKSASPYSQSKFIGVDKLKTETHPEYEERTWKERCHWNKDGNMFIPPMSFKNCLSEAAKYLSKSIPGQGKKTYTAKFESGVMCTEPLVLPVTRDSVDHEWLFVPADGRRGGTTRVKKCFPIVYSWEGEVEYLIFDEIISKDVFTEHLEDAGRFVGLGRFRPRNNGYYGRFTVESVEWS
jgi:hypothetical protein